jgi:hypothetical protein
MQFKNSQYEKSLYGMIIITFEKAIRFTKFYNIAVNDGHDCRYLEAYLVSNFSDFSEFFTFALQDKSTA